jgi:hypothetical protein
MRGKFFRKLWLPALLLISVAIPLQPEVQTFLRGPVRMHNGFVGYVISGIFQEYVDRGELVFYLINDNMTVRLIFYCNPTNVINPPSETFNPGVGQASGTANIEQWQFCTNATQVPLSEGEYVKLRGTLIIPSDWNPKLSYRNMRFDADLYVIKIL